MELEINIAQPVFEQFVRQLGGPPAGNSFDLPARHGLGKLVRRSFPAQLELLHLQFTLRESFTLRSFNPEASDWLLINGNLSAEEVRKRVNEQDLSLQRSRPAGMLLYSPGTRVFSHSPPGIPFEIILLRFPQTLVDTYFQPVPAVLEAGSPALLYEDLDLESELELRRVLSDPLNAMQAHACLLSSLGRFFEKLATRDREGVGVPIHPEDLKGLFLAAGQLRDPLRAESPTVVELARMAGMGLTKFKASFKQVFGLPPMKYRARVRMEYAREELLTGKATPSELSYRLGYAHPSGFTDAFKKYHGRLPSEIRPFDFSGKSSGFSD